MKVPSEYTITRAAGIKAGFFEYSSYDDFMKSCSMRELVKNLHETPYQPFIIQTFTELDPVFSFMKAINNTAKQRWLLLTKNASDDLRKGIDRIERYNDLCNLVMIINQEEAVSDTTFMPVPGSRISVNIWNELAKTETIKELRGKLAIFAPELYEILSRDLNYLENSVDTTISILKAVNMIYFGSKKPEMILPNPVAYFMLDLVNKLILRISLRTETYSHVQIRRILYHLYYWSALSGYIGKQLDEENQDRWYLICSTFLGDQDENQNQDLLEYDFIEEKSTKLILRHIEKQARFSRDPLGRLVEVLFKIQTEAQNLVWIGYGIHHNLPRPDIRRRIIA